MHGQSPHLSDTSVPDSYHGVDSTVTWRLLQCYLHMQRGLERRQMPRLRFSSFRPLNEMPRTASARPISLKKNRFSSIEWCRTIIHQHFHSIRSCCNDQQRIWYESDVFTEGIMDWNLKWFWLLLFPSIKNKFNTTIEVVLGFIYAFFRRFVVLWGIWLCQRILLTFDHHRALVGM